MFLNPKEYEPDFFDGNLVTLYNVLMALGDSMALPSSIESSYNQLRDDLFSILENRAIVLSDFLSEEDYNLKASESSGS